MSNSKFSAPTLKIQKKFDVLANDLHDNITPSQQGIETIVNTRKSIQDIIHDRSDKILCVVGPCSIHNTNEAMDYVHKLAKISKRYQDKLVIVMRTYFEKPRTTVGWKGFILDPMLDNSYDVNKGLKLARQLLVDINDIGVGCATEFLNIHVAEYISDLISWGAIGARTTASQIHRELTSGLPCPVGFKNSTEGSVELAIDAMLSASHAHVMLGSSNAGKGTWVETSGNPDTHIILRGSDKGPNYYYKDVKCASNILASKQLNSKIMIDCSHGNSLKNYKNQSDALDNVCKQIVNKNILGVMIESNIMEGNQSIYKTPLQYGVSITDCCVSIQETEKMLDKLYNVQKHQ